jgi:DNA-directed RNA polymerase subunit M/transcription elongation factor TFIIS
MKCPLCGDEKRQENIGQVQSQEPDQSSVTLYRCGSCDFLYTVPPLDEDKRDPRD